MNTSITTSESSVQQLAIERAIRLLTAAKAAFAVQMPNGSFVGELTVAVKSPRRKANNWRIAMPGYINQVKAMQIGDVVSWTVKTDESIESFRSTVSSQGCQLYGKGAFMTAVTGHYLEAMRVE
jgi:hypothetical protein